MAYDTPSEPLPPIMADPADVFRDDPAEGNQTFNLLERLARVKSQAHGQDTSQIAQDGPIDSPGPKDAAE